MSFGWVGAPCFLSRANNKEHVVLLLSWATKYDRISDDKDFFISKNRFDIKIIKKRKLMYIWNGFVFYSNLVG